jgi:predicted RNase H-like HicB family nuclease
MANAEEALAVYVEGLREDGEPFEFGVIRRTVALPA